MSLSGETLKPLITFVLQFAGLHLLEFTFALKPSVWQKPGLIEWLTLPAEGVSSAWGQRLHSHFQGSYVGSLESLSWVLCVMLHMRTFGAGVKNQLTVTEKKMSETRICTCCFAPPPRSHRKYRQQLLVKWTHCPFSNTQGVVKDCRVPCDWKNLANFFLCLRCR